MKRKVTGEKYLEAVRRTKSLKDSEVATFLGINRSSVFRFRNDEKNVDIINQARAFLEEISNVSFDARFVSFESFERIPIILNWVDLMTVRRVSDIVKHDRLRSFYNVCRRLKTHPENLSLDQCSILVTEMSKLYERDEKAPKGLSYINIRKPIRSFFQLVRGISGERLTAKGIDAGRSKGAGSQAKERVTKEQRAKFPGELLGVIEEYDKLGKLNGIPPELLFLEIQGLAHWMYYTATRIGLRRKERGSLGIKLNNPKHKLDKDGFWYINLIDKGKKGGLEWNKPLFEDGKEKLKTYISRRFNIPYEDVETKIMDMNEYLFPICKRHSKLETAIMKETLRRCGKVTNIANHIWRHTFAQDALHATDWNYELCASIGGWADTNTMKQSYGEITDDAKQRGLMRMMNIPVPDVTYELRW